MNTIEIDEKGIFAYETPEQCADKKDCLANSLDWQKSFCGCLNELESAKRDRVYFKDKEPVYKLMPGLDLFPEQFLGKSYPVPEWYEVKICVEPNLRTQSSKKYAILVSKRNDPVINEYHSTEKCKSQAGIFEEDFGAKIEGDDGTLPSKTILPFPKTKDQIDREIIAMVFPETIEEAAGSRAVKIAEIIKPELTADQQVFYVAGFQEGFISSKDYWYEQFKKEKI